MGGLGEDVLTSESGAQREGLDRDLGVLGVVLYLALAPSLDKGAGIPPGLFVERLDPLIQAGGSRSPIGSRNAASWAGSHSRPGSRDRRCSALRSALRRTESRVEDEGELTPSGRTLD